MNMKEEGFVLDAQNYSPYKRLLIKFDQILAEADEARGEVSNEGVRSLK